MRGQGVVAGEVFCSGRRAQAGEWDGEAGWVDGWMDQVRPTGSVADDGLVSFPLDQVRNDDGGMLPRQEEPLVAS
jgi:hypothetical protein